MYAVIQPLSEVNQRARNILIQELGCLRKSFSRLTNRRIFNSQDNHRLGW